MFKKNENRNLFLLAINKYPVCDIVLTRNDLCWSSQLPGEYERFKDHSTYNRWISVLPPSTSKTTSRGGEN